MNNILMRLRPADACIRWCLLLVTLGCGVSENLLSTEDSSHRNDIVFPICEGELWGAIDSEGDVLTEPIYDNTSYGFVHPVLSGASKLVGQQGALLTSQNRWCYVNSNGAHSVEPIMNDVWRVFNFGESLFGLELPTEKRGYDAAPSWTLWASVEPAAIYDPYGKWNPPPNILPVQQFSEGLLVVVKDGKFGYADRDGTVVVPPKYDAATTFSEGLARVMLEDKWGYVNRVGDLVIASQFNMCRPFDQGIAIVGIDGSDKLFFIDKKGKMLHEWSYPLERTYFLDGLTRRRDPKTGLDGYCDVKGEWRVAPTFQETEVFKEGLAQVTVADSLQSGFIDLTGNFRIPISDSKRVQGFRYGLAWVETYGQRPNAGYINREGKWVWSQQND